MEAFNAWIENFSFSSFADVMSVIGFCFTIYVLLTIRKIKNFYVFKARVPDLLKKVTKQASQLSQFHNNFEDSKPQILLVIGQVEVTLKSLNKKVDRQVKNSIKEVSKHISGYKTNRDKSRLWDIYVSLQKVNQEIVNLQEDRSWETNNG